MIVVDGDEERMWSVMDNTKYIPWELASPALIRKTLKKIKSITKRQTTLEDFYD